MNGKKMLFGISGGVIGAAVGWVLGEFLAYQFLERYEEDVLVDPDIYEKALDTYLPKELNGEEPVLLKPEKRTEVPKVINYTETSKEGKLIPYEEHTEEEVESLQDLNDIEDADPEDDGPVIVEEDEWSEPPNNYPSETLTYYTDDRVLTNEKGEIINGAVVLVGSLALDSFGEGSSDPDTVFVRNDDEGKYFEIIRIHGSYDEIVLGIPKATVKKTKMKAKVKELTEVDEEEYAKRKGARKTKANLVNEAPEE